MLSKRPDLTRRLAKAMPIDADNDSRKSLVETTADVLQKPFTECLAERTVSRSGIGPDGKPEGRKAAIYLFANMILRLLFKVSFFPLKTLASLTFVERQRAPCKANVYQHISKLSSPWAISCKSTSYLSLLSWTIPILQQPLLLGTALPPSSLQSMPCTMFEASTAHTDTFDTL